ncbi:MAG: hypothetical protein CMG00_03255 [Candidatus Marinimicrobia bacterium]|nr:hypothetical protein [Candidatus Neomarinimicrobiota bacterium]
MNLKKIPILFLVCFVFAQFDWQSNGVSVRQGVHIEWQRSADDVGDAVIFAWSDTRNGGRDIYAQKVDYNGNIIWQEGGIAIVQSEGRQEDPLLVSDGNGGAYIAWVDYKNEPLDGDIYAQHINAQGLLSWDIAGIPLTTVVGKQVSPNMCSDGLGGAYVIWKDLTVSSYGYIYGTHLSLTGALALETGIAILDDNGFHNGVSIEKAGQGHAVLTWADNDAGNNSNVKAQRINQNCEKLWSDSSNNSFITVSSNDGDQLYAKVTYYDESHSILVWEDHRNGVFGDIYYDFLDVSGNSVFSTSGGQPLCIDGGDQIKPRVKASYDGAYVIWEDKRNLNTDIYIQKVDYLGNIYFENNGVSVVSASGNQNQARLTVDGLGGAYIVWSDERLASFPQTDIYFQHIQSDGTFSFPVDGEVLCDEPYYQFSPIVRAKDGQGLAIWGDQRSGSIGLYIQKMNALGTQFSNNGQEVFFGIDGNGKFPKSITLNSEESVIYWNDRRESPFSSLTYGKKINSQFSMNVDNLNGSPLSSNAYQSDAMLVDTGQNLFLGFTQSDGDQHQYFDILDYNLESVSSSSNPVYPSDGFSQEYFSITKSEDGYVYYVYSDNSPYGIYGIYVNKYDNYGGAQWSSPVNIVSSIATDDLVQATFSNPNGGVIILYNSGSWQGSNIYAISVSGDGQVSDGWNADGVQLCSSDSDQFIESYTATPYGILLTFTDSKSGFDDVYSQMITYDGNIVFGDDGLNISNIQDSDQSDSSVSYSDIADAALICWEDRRSGSDSDLYCKYIQLQGQLIRPSGTISFDINSYNLSNELILAEEVGNQTNPFVYATQSGSFLIAWEDSRSGVDKDIYFQEISGPNFKLADGGIVMCDADFNQLNPEINIYSESNKSYMIYWDDLRSSGKESLNNIYVQSYSIDWVNLDNSFNQIPVNYSIESVYPNPFNPSINISFNIDKIDNVKISIFNILGEEIDVLYNRNIHPGNHRIQWSPATDVSSGLYIVRIDAQEQGILTKKITLLK